MKRVLFLMIAVALGWGVKAQCPLTTAVDFTATDVHGTEVHLFDILDGGQYVLIDFFFTTCGPCQQVTPKIVSSYYSFGCNMHDVFYMEIASGDSHQACLNWVNNYGVEYPTISGVEGGTQICNQYGIGSYPTIILIAPDHSIVIRDLWPVANVQTIITALENQGLEQHDCTGPTGELTITPDTLWYSQMGEDQTFTILNETAEAVTIEDVIPEAGSALEIWQPSFPYTLEAGQSVEVVVGLQVPPLKDDYTAFGIRVLTSLGEKMVTAMVQNTALDTGLILGPYFMVALDSLNPTLDLYLANGNAGTNNPIVINSIIEGEAEGGPYLNIELSGELPTTLNSGDEYRFTIRPIDNGAKGYASTTVDVNYEGGTSSYLVEIDGTLLSIAELQKDLILFPNPANNVVTLKSESLGAVHIFNILGQKIDEFHPKGNELEIVTSDYQDGIYFIRTDEKTLKFVVRH